MGQSSARVIKHLDSRRFEPNLSKNKFIVEDKMIARVIASGFQYYPEFSQGMG